MSTFKVMLTATNPNEEHRSTPPMEALVDTGAFLSCLPRQLLLDVGITPRGKKWMRTATGQSAEREFGYAILEAEGRNTISEVIFAEAGEMTLLGAMTLEGFNVMVDPVGQCFVDFPDPLPLPTLVPDEQGE